jgi:hypothetical protein
MNTLQIATNGLLSFSLLGVASDGYLGVSDKKLDYLSISGKRSSLWQRRQDALAALKKDLWYLYQDENEPEVKTTLNEVINDDFSKLEELIKLLTQHLAEKQLIAAKASREEYVNALLAAQKMKKIVRQQKEDKIFILLF